MYLLNLGVGKGLMLALSCRNPWAKILQDFLKKVLHDSLEYSGRWRDANGSCLLYWYDPLWVHCVLARRFIQRSLLVGLWHVELSEFLSTSEVLSWVSDPRWLCSHRKFLLLHWTWTIGTARWLITQQATWCQLVHVLFPLLIWGTGRGFVNLGVASWSP